MDFTIAFIKIFFVLIYMAMPLLLFLASVVVVLGLVVGHREGWRPGDSVYWAFITATTVGYGDIRPLKPISRFFSVMIAFVGVIFTGILVSLAVQASSSAFIQHQNLEQAQQLLDEAGYKSPNAN